MQDLKEIQQQFSYITYIIQSCCMVRFCIAAWPLFFLIYFWYPNYKILTILKHMKYQACTISTYDCSIYYTLYTTLPNTWINTFWCYNLPEAKDAIKEWKLQSGFYSDCSLTELKGATLSTLSSTGLSGIIFQRTELHFTIPKYQKVWITARSTKRPFTAATQALNASYSIYK